MTAGPAKFHHAVVARARESEIISPSEACGGCAPRPRKLRLDSVRIAQDKAKLICTMIAAATLGRMWTTRIRAGWNPESFSRFDVLTGSKRQHGAAGDSGEDRRVHDGDRDRRVTPARTQGGDDSQRQQDRGEGEEDVGYAHGHSVEPATEEPRCKSDRAANHRSNCDCRNRDLQREPDAVERSGQHIASELVAPQKERPRRPLQSTLGVLLGWRVRSDSQDRYRHRDQQHCHDDAARDSGVTPSKASHERPGRAH